MIEGFRPEDARHRNAETVLMPYLAKWLKTLPGNKVLEIGSGEGIEANFMRSQGYTTFELDISEVMLRHSSSDTILADCLRIPLKDNSINGTFIKDLVVFFNKKEKTQLFTNLHRIMTSGGSVFLYSQLSDINRIRYIPKQSRYPQTEYI